MSLIPIATKLKSVDESLEAIVLTDNKVIVTKGFATGQVLAMDDWQILSGGRLPLTRASAAAVPFVSRRSHRGREAQLELEEEVAWISTGGFRAAATPVQEEEAERSTTASPVESDAEDDWPAAWPVMWKHPAANDWVAFEARREEAERRAREAEMELEEEAAWATTVQEEACSGCEFAVCRCAEDVAAGDEEDTDAKQSRAWDELALIDAAALELEKETDAEKARVMSLLDLIAAAARRGDKVVRLVL